MGNVLFCQKILSELITGLSLNGIDFVCIECSQRVTASLWNHCPFYFSVMKLRMPFLSFDVSNETQATREC